MGYKWVHGSLFTAPPNAVVGGRDADGTVIYIARSNYNGDNLPAKFMPSKRAAYVSYNGKEILVHNIEILVESKLSWTHSSNGSVPPGAVVSGYTTGGEPLYIGRGNHQGSITVGKVHPSHRCLYIPFGGDEIRLSNYEVLVEY